MAIRWLCQITVAATLIVLWMDSAQGETRGVRGSDGKWLCDTSYIATANGCAPAPAKAQAAPPAAAGPRVEYGTVEPPTGRGYWDAHDDDIIENYVDEGMSLCGRYRGYVDTWIRG